MQCKHFWETLSVLDCEKPPMLSICVVQLHAFSLGACVSSNTLLFTLNTANTAERTQSLSLLQ
jgi:hypothetical protein